MDGIYFPVYYLSGFAVFGLLRSSTTNALPCMVVNHDLLTKTRIQHEVFPLSNVLSALVDFCFTVLALFIVMLIFIKKPGVGFHPTLLMTLVPFLPAFLAFCLGISFILATIYIRFRDIKHIYNVVLTLWMYLTPLFYSVSYIEGHERVKMVLKLNPMYHYVTYFRQLLIGQVPSPMTHLLIYAWGLGMFGVGFLIFHFAKKKFLLYI